MEQARQFGFVVHLIYVCLDSVEGNLRRVTERVMRGGHHVPADDVRRRYDCSLANLLPAIQRADHVRIFDNSTDQEPKEMLSIEASIVIFQAPVLPQWLTKALGAFLDQQGLST